MRKRRKSLWERLWLFVKAFFTPRNWWRAFQGMRLRKQLLKGDSELRHEAQEAVDKVVWETKLAPDCVSARVVRGGPAILIKHDDAWEAFVHNSYYEAAVKAIEWVNLQGDEIKTRRTSKMNRHARRAFDIEVRGKKKHRKRKIHRHGR